MLENGKYREGLFGGIHTKNTKEEEGTKEEMEGGGCCKSTYPLDIILN